MSQSDYSKVAVEYESALNLIDLVFSLECCLHYQVLPLELSDNHLVIGMVDPKDKDTVREVNPIINSLGYSFHVQSIDIQIHQLVLATYLKSGSKNSSFHNSSHSSKIIEPSASVENRANRDLSPQSLNHSSTLIDLPEKELPPQSLNNSSTLIDFPEKELPPQSLNNSSTLIDLPEKELPPQSLKHSSGGLHERPTFIISNKEADSSNKRNKSQIFFGEAQINDIRSNNNITSQKSKIVQSSSSVDVKANYRHNLRENLDTLSSEKLWQILLSEALLENFDTIKFQVDSNCGKIVYFQNEAVKSSFDGIPMTAFKRIVKEIKLIAKLPLTRLDKNRKIAIPKIHDRQKILLRIEFFVNNFQEEVTIQVLKGQALKFYEQKQIGRTLEQAIHLSQKLEKILTKIKICKDAADSNDLKALKSAMEKVERQFKFLD